MLTTQTTNGGHAMTFLEASKLIGSEALWNAGNGLTFKVIVKDFKQAYGSKRYLVTPVNGQGETWVQSGLSFL